MFGLVLLTLVLPASAMDIVRDDPGTWTGVDYTVSYCRENPEYIPASVSYHPFFRGVSHMIAVKIIDNETIHIVDGLFNAEYTVHNWQLDGQYYHFWIDEPIKRNYIMLRDNREMVLH